MWYFRRPSERFIREFLEEQQKLSFSYPEVGSTRHGAPAGYDNDHNRALLGKGQTIFEAARSALQRRQARAGADLGLHFQVESPHVFPLDAPKRAVCMLLLGEAVLNHMNGELAVLAG